MNIYYVCNLDSLKRDRPHLWNIDNETQHEHREKMSTIFQTTSSNEFSWMKMYEFLLRFHWSSFLRVQLTIFQDWFRQWLDAGQATSHSLNQWWLIYWRIYASLGFSELNDLKAIGVEIHDKRKWLGSNTYQYILWMHTLCKHNKLFLTIWYEAEFWSVWWTGNQLDEPDGFSGGLEQE